MFDSLSSSLPYILLATSAGLLGSLIALFWNPKVRVRSAIQHFAAGAVLAAVATNVIPEVERAALIYLIAEELLVENVQAEESIYSTISLFIGFLALLILKLLESS